MPLTQEEIEGVVKMYWALNDNGVKGVYTKVAYYTGVSYQKVSDDDFPSPMFVIECLAILLGAGDHS